MGVLGEHEIVEGLYDKGPRVLNLSAHKTMRAGGPVVGLDDTLHSAVEPS